jgi:hypothetical protein
VTLASSPTARPRCGNENKFTPRKACVFI